MRKMPALFLAIAAALAVGLSAVTTAVDDGKDKVSYEEIIQFGDPKFAYGLTVTDSKHLDYHLFWETEYEFGDKPNISTDFKFSSDRQYYLGPHFYNGVELQSSFEYGFSDYRESDGITEEEHIASLTGLNKAYHELAAKTEPGSEGSMVIKLKDYYDYYPIYGTIDIPNCTFSWDPEIIAHIDPVSQDYVVETIVALDNFFKIPILENDLVEIHVETNAAGDPHNWGSGMLDGSETVHFYTTSVITDDACYFTFTNKTNLGNAYDTSLIPGGYGIYKMPYYEMSPGSNAPKPDELEMVYPIDEESEFQCLYYLEEHSRLLLHTREEGNYVFTLIDVPSMETVQRLELPYFPDEDGYTGQSVRLEDGFLAVITYTENLDDELYDTVSVISITKEGMLEHEFTTDIVPFGERLSYYMRWNTSFDFDGEKLAIVDSEYNFRNYDPTSINYCGFKVMVFDVSGLLYEGIYLSSLGVGESTQYTVRSSDDPLIASWQ